MSMSTNVIGFRPPDKKWHKMKAIYDACELAGINAPDEVDNFFNGEPPDDAGIEISLENYPCCSDYNNDSQSGFEIDIAGLPSNIKTIRFFNGW